ncbi:DNA-binding protein [Actinoplanes sp. CA-054009]
MTRNLMGIAEIRARMGGITRQRVYQLALRPDWPEPYDELVQGRVWQIDDIEAWIAANRPALADPITRIDGPGRARRPGRAGTERRVSG